MHRLVCLKNLVAENASFYPGYLYGRAHCLDSVWTSGVLGLQSDGVWALLSIFEYQVVLFLWLLVIRRGRGSGLVALPDEYLGAIHILIVNLHINSTLLLIVILIKSQRLPLQIAHNLLVLLQISIFLWDLNGEHAKLLLLWYFTLFLSLYGNQQDTFRGTIRLLYLLLS